MTLKCGMIRKSFSHEGRHMVATSVKYLYERLGAETFQQLVSALLSSQFPRFQAMPLGQADGGRDGLAQVGSKTLIYQVKFSVAGHEKDPVAWLSSILGIRISPVTVLTQMITDHGMSSSGMGTLRMLERVLVSAIRTRPRSVRPRLTECRTRSVLDIRSISPTCSPRNSPHRKPPTRARA